MYKGAYDSTDAAHKRTVNEIANIAFLTKQANLGISSRDPQKYLPEVVGRFPDALRQQAVPQGQGLWDITRFEEFLGERRRILAEAINTFMDSLLAETTPKGQTINDLIARGEGPELEFKTSIRWDHVTGALNPVLEKVIAKTVAGS